MFYNDLGYHGFMLVLGYVIISLKLWVRVGVRVGFRIMAKVGVRARILSPSR